jgi:signal peptidase I
VNPGQDTANAPPGRSGKENHEGGVPQPEPGIDHSRIDGTYFGPVTVPAGHVFVLGDNRAGSIDSRIYGSVPLGDLQATVLWPAGR